MLAVCVVGRVPSHPTAVKHRWNIGQLHFVCTRCCH